MLAPDAVARDVDRDPPVGDMRRAFIERDAVAVDDDASENCTIDGDVRLTVSAAGEDREQQ